MQLERNGRDAGRGAGPGCQPGSRARRGLPATEPPEGRATGHPGRQRVLVQLELGRLLFILKPSRRGKKMKCAWLSHTSNLFISEVTVTFPHFIPSYGSPAFVHLGRVEVPQPTRKCPDHGGCDGAVAQAWSPASREQPFSPEGRGRQGARALSFEEAPCTVS